MHALRHRQYAAPIALVSALFLLPAVAVAQAPVAKVNGVAIPQAKLDAILKARAAGKQPDTPEIRAAIRDTLINQEVVAQEAIKKGFDRNPEVAAPLFNFQAGRLDYGANLVDFVLHEPAELFRRIGHDLRALRGNRSLDFRQAHGL